jgi:hypothetical protein
LSICAHAAKNDARIAAVGRIGRRHRVQALMRGLHQDLGAVQVDRIAGTQQRHALHRPAIDVNAADVGGDLQPQASSVHAELGQQCTLGVVAHAQQTAGFPHNAMDAGDQGPIGLLAIAEMESEIFHAAGD